MNNSELKENIEKVIKENKLTVNKALTESGAGKNLVSNINQGQFPSIDKIIKLADYLNVSMDYLTGRISEPTQQIITNNGGEIGKAVQAQTYNSSSELNGLQKEMVEAMEQLPKSKQLEALQEVYKILEENK